MALIDTLTNYVLSADERVPTQKDILYGSNGNDAMSLCYEVTEFRPDTACLIIVADHFCITALATCQSLALEYDMEFIALQYASFNL